MTLKARYDSRLMATSGLMLAWCVACAEGQILEPQGTQVEPAFHNIAVKRVMMPPRLVRSSTNVRQLGPWDDAAWVWAKDTPLPAEGEFLRFRKTFTADGITPLRFHVSADERFVLLLDGEVVARGPDRGDPTLWFVQSYETTFTKGVHRVEAVCWRMRADLSPNAQLSWRGGFLFKAEGGYDAALTTGRAPWEVARLTGTRMTEGKYPMAATGAQCAVTGTGLPWETPPESAYMRPVIVRGPVPCADAPDSGSTRRPGWLLYPSELPAQMARPTRPGGFTAADGQTFATNGVWSAVARGWASNGWWRADAAHHPAVAQANALLKDGTKMTFAPHTKTRLLWDLGDYYCAYPELAVTGGRGSKMGWAWAESLYVGDCFDWHTVVTDKERKGATSRAKWTDKYFYGPEDVFLADGRAGARFTIPWWRCGRWCEIEIETADEPLTFDGVTLVETRYPFEPEGYFRCDDPSIDAVRRICVRGLQMCMHEMYFDCPHYEQQMYGGDTRVQMLAAGSLSADERLARQAFRLLEQSQRDNGLVSMNYPTTWLQESSTYTLIWTLMLGDAALWRDDPDWLRARMPAVRKWLFGVEEHVNAAGLLENLPGWSFMDWVPEWPYGMAPGGGYGQGVSSQNSLLYLLALQSAARVEDALGECELATRWRTKARILSDAIERTFWCEARGLVADTPAQDCFSEHAQCLAILAELLPPDRARRAFDGLISAPDLARCTVYFSHYLFETYCHMGRSDLFLKRLDLWRDFVKQDLKTPLEGPGDARSDCHGWGSHPLYHLQTGVAGIRPASAGFKTVRIAPSPGSLKWIKASVPAPQGLVRIDLSFLDGRVSGQVELPPGMTGEFVWRGVSRVLQPGFTHM